jgi:hypothetical protein
MAGPDSLLSDFPQRFGTQRRILRAMPGLGARVLLLPSNSHTSSTQAMGPRLRSTVGGAHFLKAGSKGFPAVPVSACAPQCGGRSMGGPPTKVA